MRLTPDLDIRLSELSSVQGVLLGAALVLAGFLVRWLLAGLKGKRSTLYVLGDAHGERGLGTVSARRSEPADPSALGSGPATAPSAVDVEFDDGRSDDEGEEFDREMPELELTPGRPRLVAAESARGRGLCPCCGYPGGYDPVMRTSCALCDWDEPSAEAIEWGVARSDWRRALAAARENYQATGSALSQEDRASWAGELTPEQTELRLEARLLFDYLRSDDRPDVSEVLERADVILAQLREIEDRPRWDDEGK